MTSKSELWTVDGPELQALRFYVGLDSKDTLFRQTGKAKLPEYRNGMTPNDVMELVVDSFSRAGLHRVQPGELKPHRFAGHPGFRFEFAYLTADGLEGSGLAVGGVTQKGRLVLILYTGARAHYYGKYKPVVQRLVDSVRFA